MEQQANGSPVTPGKPLSRWRRFLNWLARKPDPRTLQDYDRVLTKRFSLVKKSLEEVEAGAIAVANQTAESAALLEPSKVPTGLEEAIGKLRSSGTAAKKKHDELSEDYAKEAACGYVNQALDLQVTKAGSLLTYNGLAVAVATVLWTNNILSSLPPYIKWPSGTLIFALLLVSSLLCLMTVVVRIGQPADYSSAAVELERSIDLTIWRGRVVNGAVRMAIVATMLIAVVVAVGALTRRPTAAIPVFVSKPVEISTKRDPSFRIRDTLNLSCRVPAPSDGRRHTIERHGMECVLVPSR